MERYRLYVWGFSPQILQTWPDDIEPVPVDHAPWPTEAPVVVYGRAWNTFQARCDAGEIETTTDAVLYLPVGMDEPDEAWPYFDEVVHEENAETWTRLRSLAQHPHHHQVKTWADAVPAEQLDMLHRLDRHLDYQNLPLPESVLALLRTPAYQTLFEEAVQERLRMRRLALGFSEEQLEDYVLGDMDEATRQQVEALLAASAAMQDNLERVRNELTTPLLDAALVEDQAQSASAGQQALAALLGGFLVQAWIRSRSRQWTRQALYRSDTEDDLPSVLEAVEHGTLVSIEAGAFQCQLRYAADRQALEFYDVRGAGGRRKPVFWIELHAGDTLRQALRSEAGRALLPLDVLAQALAQGANRLLITSA